MSRRLEALIAFAVLAVAPAVGAVIPASPRLIGAVAEVNRAAAREVALGLELELLDGAGSVVGTGELVADPSGSARLELRAPTGLVERHLRRGLDYRVSRNGVPVEDPKPLLPPVAWFQIGDGPRLEQALRRAGIAVESVALGREGDRDCYVIGGRMVGGDGSRATLRASFWVELEALQPVRIDRSDGIRYVLGPPATFGPLRVPAWIQVELAGQPYLRMVVRAAQTSQPTAMSFDTSWLAAPRTEAPAGGLEAVEPPTQ